MSPSEFYNSKISDRKPYEDRAILIARLTLPYAIRETGDTGITLMTESNSQSLGGYAVNNLKAKMGMALLPPSTSSFRLVPDSTELDVISQGDPDNRMKINSELSNITAQINNEIEIQQIRESLFNLILQLIIVGSTLVEKVPKRGIVLHGLQSFVVELDNQGYPLKICLHETLKRLPDGIVPAREQDDYDLYTMFSMDDDSDRWTMQQELDGDLLPDREKHYPSYDKLPVRYLGWTWMNGDYCHRPYAEDYYSDFVALDTTGDLLTDGARVAAKILLFVNERGGRTKKGDVAESKNGDVVDGSAEDVTALQLNKNFDFQMPAEREARIQNTIERAFLVAKSITREAERVTAQEIMVMARELESSSLSGIYSKLSLQWSKWIIEKIMGELGIEFKSIDVKIITGLDALGRSQEAQKLDAVVRRAVELNLRKRLKDEELLNRYAAFEGVDTVGLFKTNTEIEKEDRALEASMARQRLMESGAEAAGKTAGMNMATPQQGEQ